MTITMDRAKVLATRYAEVRKARGRSLERSAAEMGLSLRTCQRLANLAAGTDPDYSPDTGTLDAVEAWLNTVPPPDVNASEIDHIVAIVRAANLGVAAGEAVVTAFRAVWGVALAHRPWYGNDEDAAALLRCLRDYAPISQHEAARIAGMESDSDRFIRARSALVALGLLHPHDGLLSLTDEGRARAECEDR
jgi:transcriptional regulator with XRE-family HTH domain